MASFVIEIDIFMVRPFLLQCIVKRIGSISVYQTFLFTFDLLLSASLFHLFLFFSQSITEIPNENTSEWAINKRKVKTRRHFSSSLLRMKTNWQNSETPKQQIDTIKWLCTFRFIGVVDKTKMDAFLSTLWWKMMTESHRQCFAASAEKNQIQIKRATATIFSCITKVFDSYFFRISFIEIHIALEASLKLEFISMKI